MIRLIAALLPLALLATPAAAHLPPEDHGAFMAGLSHPFFGLDHILAMLVVGIWATQIGGRAVWAVPAGFVGAMTLGFILALAGVTLPFVEPMILASTIVLGALVAFALRPSRRVAPLVAAAFGLFHGYAHGAELGAATAWAYGVGFVTATIALHVAGIWLGGAMAKAHRWAPRALGAISALAGLSLVFG